MAATDKKKKNLKLVSFDDGGVRGLSQLEMMQTIMHGLTFETESSDLPCHHFDLMGGSGTGGLITIFFTKFRMSADEAMEEFAKIVEEVYEPEDLEPLERSNCLRQCIEDIMKRRGHPLDMKLCEETQSQQCAGFVLVSLRSNVESPIPLRAYSIRSQTKTPMTVIEAALATCAMPPDFVPLSIGKTKYTKKEYIAAIGTSNPINELIAEADSLFGSDSRVAYLLSMGAGNPGVITLPSSDEEKGFYSTILKMMNDCERTAGAVEERLRESKIYHRLSVKQGMQNHLSDEMLLEMIVTHTAAYIASNEAHEKIKNLVESASVEVGPVTMDQLTGRSAISSEIAEGVKELRSHNLSKQDEEMIAKLKPAGLKCESHVPACLDGTRSDILDQIEAWSMDFEAPNILWLNGHPGVGKSAISATLVEKWHSSGRLGSEFFFQRDRPEQMTANTLWRVVAHDLSRRYPSIRKELLTALRSNEYFITTSQVDIFQALVYKPLEIGEKDISNESSSIIVIDALDECGGLDGRFSNDRRNLLQAIKAWPGLPKKFKLLITSRAEYDIERIFSDIKPYSIEIPSGNAVNDKTKNDIRDFIIYKLNQIKTEYEHLPPDWPGEVILDNLVKDAAGLFLWIDTVMKLLERSEPELTLKKILDGHHGGMPNLYEWILKASFPDPDQDVIDRFRSVLGAIIFARAPLNATSLAQLLSNRSGVTYICNRLKAVIDDGNIIRIRHQSFTDFLLNPDQSPLTFRFRLDRGVENRSLTAHCFRIMQEKLKFNMCHIESSYLKNEKVPDLNSRIKEHIPSHLSYASQFWTSHLYDAKVDDEIKAGVRYFMKNQFLYWLEVLSFKKIVDSGLTVLEALADWLKRNNQSSSLAEDMQKFLSAFAGAISQSVPHIYLSALPFSPENSPVSQQYRGKYPKLLAVRRGGPKTWPAIQNIFHGHLEAVTSVSFSQDGRLLVSGSWDHTIRVWDVATGDKIIGPLKGHFGSVWSVSFSHDGKRIADSIRSVASSPDGRRIVSGSADNTIRVWDAETGKTVMGPLNGHSGWVNSVSFSPDGRRIVSGSEDMTIRIWDAVTGETMIGPSEGRIKVATPILGSQVGTSGSHVPDAKVPDAKVASALETKPDPDDGPVCSNIFDSSLTEDGWMLGRNSELLFWVPPEIRPKLSPLRNVLTIGQATELDFTNFVHGKGWIHCEEKLGQTV
ncbi:hypothetical protein M408DRAFT_333630 [Serendipita vermifera MAFF 305830]|uniref:NACHT domain-containing protein n=1 Tax=Serendipita vermifera MAFF 305830 TaxID=933852 RepID=A0A0C3A980_SERVB|nr:hypothetical protein M408DRAFT_333630 [Serendipita vermifera MAFF 305830]